MNANPIPLMDAAGTRLDTIEADMDTISISPARNFGKTSVSVPSALSGCSTTLTRPPVASAMPAAASVSWMFIG